MGHFFVECFPPLSPFQREVKYIGMSKSYICEWNSEVYFFQPLLITSKRCVKYLQDGPGDTYMCCFPALFLVRKKCSKLAGKHHAFVQVIQSYEFFENVFITSKMGVNNLWYTQHLFDKFPCSFFHFQKKINMLAGQSPQFVNGIQSWNFLEYFYNK